MKLVSATDSSWNIRSWIYHWDLESGRKMHILVRQTEVPDSLWSKDFILWPGSLLRLEERIQGIVQSVLRRDTCVWTQLWMISPFLVLHNVLTIFVPPCPFWGMTLWVCSGGSENLFPDIAKKGTTNGDKQESYFKTTIQSWTNPDSTSPCPGHEDVVLVCIFHADLRVLG